MENALKALLDVMGHGERLTARPGRVLLDRSSGTDPVEVEWSADAHAQALEALTEPISIDGVQAFAVRGTVVLVRAPDPNRRIADLAAEGVLSAIAARTLDAALEVGRNVLVAGAWPEASAVMAALTGGGRRPGALLDPTTAPPASWVQVASPADLALLNPDRVCLWQTPPQHVVPFASCARSLVAWIGASRLDRALVRYEAAIEGASPRSNAQMQVLAGLDVIVTVQRSSDGPRVREIAELVMMDDGYRPHLLFAGGAPPMQNTLVPVELPTFAHELRVAGHGVLAEELEAAVGEVPPRPPQAAPAPPMRSASIEAAVAPSRPGPAPTPVQTAMSVFSRPLDAGEMEDLREATPPGWELDQLGDEDLPQEDYGEGSADDAAMAATYGLAPPPRPKGVSGESFDDILKKMRDGELQDRDE